jgi:hypothetical protein
MVERTILRDCGVTASTLRRILTATDGEEAKTREKVEERIRSRIREGVYFNIRHADMYMALDMAWDSQPIQKEMMPLMMYAMGRLKKSDCIRELGKVCDDVSKFCEMGTGEQKQTVKDINVPRLYETSINLIRSYLTRRVAAQVDRFEIFPYLQYEPRGVSPTAKLKADALSQRVEIMSDQFNYRHQGAQFCRDMLLYGHTVLFPSWQRDIQWRRKRLGRDFDIPYERSQTGIPENIETVVEREGLEFTNPHPTRVFYDVSSPLSGLNTAGGPSWVGYWDIKRFQDVADNPDFFNTEKIRYSQHYRGLLQEHGPFFSFYFDPCVLEMPSPDSPFSASYNDRKNNVGVYLTGTGDKDKGVLLTEYYEKVVPKDEGFGNYPHPVWIRYVVASDDTVVFAEPITTTCAAVYQGYNEHDGRLVNASMGHELMALQDQMQNILSQLLLTLRTNLFKIWLINKEALDEPSRQYMEKVSKAMDFYVEPHILWASMAKDRDELGIDFDNIIKIIESNTNVEIERSFAAIRELLNLADRLLLISPNEAAQVAQRETTASEIVQVANTTNAMYNFITSGINEARSAQKMMIYEALITQSTQPLRVPVVGRYSPKVVEEAGFEIEGTSYDLSDPRKRKMVIVGTMESLIYEYNFSSRDGQQRPSKTLEAQTIMQLLAPILGNERLAQRISQEKIDELLNLVAYNLGFDLKITEEDDEETQQGGQGMPTFEEVVGQVMQNTQMLQQIVQAIQGGGQGGGPPGGSPQRDGEGPPPQPQGPRAGPGGMGPPAFQGETAGVPEEPGRVPRPPVTPLPQI